MKREELLPFFNKQRDTQQTVCNPEIFNIPIDDLIIHFIELSKVQLDRVTTILQQLSINSSIPLAEIINYQNDYQNQNTQLLEIFLTHACNPKINLTWLTMPLIHLDINSLYSIVTEELTDESRLMKALNPESKTTEKAEGDVVKKNISRAARFPRAARNFPLFKIEELELKDDHEKHKKSATRRLVVKKAKLELEQETPYKRSESAKKAARNRKLRKQRHLNMLSHSKELAIENQQIGTEIKTLLQEKNALLAKVRTDLRFFPTPSDKTIFSENVSNLGEGHGLSPS